MLMVMVMVTMQIMMAMLIILVGCHITKMVGGMPNLACAAQVYTYA